MKKSNGKWVLLLAFGLQACGSASDPVRNLSRDLGRFPEYSLIVDDLRVDEGFFPDYFLRFKIMTASGQKVAGKDTLVYQDRVSEWYEVSGEVFGRYENYVGMVVASKSLDGQTTGVRQAHPAGYGHVGNSHYGYWGGGGFWHFYGQYAFMSSMMGGWNVNRNDYGDYRRNREQGRPYYGPVTNGRPAFGSTGTVTQKARPSFYNRNQSRRQSFASKAQGRMGRSSSSWGRGK